MEKVSALMKDIYSEIFSCYLPHIFGKFSNHISSLENLLLFTTDIGTYKFLLLPGHLPSIQSYGCFLFLVGGHLLTCCMAL
jgi:hypothetical protein